MLVKGMRPLAQQITAGFVIWHSSPPSVTVVLKEFLLTEQRCPVAWRSFDLYQLRDDAAMYYVGQSCVHFDRVWRHILDG